MTERHRAGLACVLGALAVGLGAIGAHAIRDRVPPADLDIWKTAAQYHGLHSVALLALARRGGWPWWAMLAGLLIFALTLYAIPLTGLRWLGAVTPVGGVLLILGWLGFAWGFLRGQEALS